MRVHKHDFMEAGGETERERERGQHLMAAGSQSESELKLAAAVRNEESMQESGMRERERGAGASLAQEHFCAFVLLACAGTQQSPTHIRAHLAQTQTRTHTLAGIRIGIGMLTHFGGSDGCCCCCCASCQLREATVTRQLQTQAQALGSKIICNF